MGYRLDYEQLLQKYDAALAENADLKREIEILVAADARMRGLASRLRDAKSAEKALQRRLEHAREKVAQQRKKLRKRERAAVATLSAPYAFLIAVFVASFVWAFTSVVGH